jgi:hypothetical protein
VKLTVFLANFDRRARKTTGAVRSRKFPLWRPYGDNALARNEIKQMASYRSYMLLGLIRGLLRIPVRENSSKQFFSTKIGEKKGVFLLS